MQPLPKHFEAGKEHEGWAATLSQLTTGTRAAAAATTTRKLQQEELAAGAADAAITSEVPLEWELLQPEQQRQLQAAAAGAADAASADALLQAQLLQPEQQPEPQRQLQATAATSDATIAGVPLQPEHQHQQRQLQAVTAQELCLAFMPQQAYKGIVHARNQYGGRVFLVPVQYDPLLKELQAGLKARQTQPARAPAAGH